MKAFLLVCVAIAGCVAEPYTLGQLYSGALHYRAAVSGQPGIVTHVEYPSSIYSGYLGHRRTFFKREAEAYTPTQIAFGKHIADAYATGHPHNIGYTAYTSIPTYGAYGYHHGITHLHGKREAEPYTIGQIAYGKHIADAYATGHPHNIGYTAYTSFPTYGAYGYHHGITHLHGKREAEPYTIGQVAAGLPLHNAALDGRLHNPGVLTHTSYSSPVYTSYSSPVYHNYQNYYGFHY